MLAVSTIWCILITLFTVVLVRFRRIGAREPDLPHGPPTTPILGNVIEFPKTKAYLHSRNGRRYMGTYSQYVSVRNEVKNHDARHSIWPVFWFRETNLSRTTLDQECLRKSVRWSILSTVHYYSRTSMLCTFYGHSTSITPKVLSLGRTFPFSCASSRRAWSWGQLHLNAVSVLAVRHTKIPFDLSFRKLEMFLAVSSMG